MFGHDFFNDLIEGAASVDAAQDFASVADILVAPGTPVTFALSGGIADHLPFAMRTADGCDFHLRCQAGNTRRGGMVEKQVSFTRLLAQDHWPIRMMALD